MRSIARDKILLSTPAQLALVRIDDSGFNQSGAPVQFSTHHCRTTSLYPHPNFALKVASHKQHSGDGRRCRSRGMLSRHDKACE